MLKIKIRVLLSFYTGNEKLVIDKKSQSVLPIMLNLSSKKRKTGWVKLLRGDRRPFTLI